MNIVTRPLSDDDLDRVCEIERASFSMPWKREDFAALIRDNNSVYLVIEADGIIAGQAGYTDTLGDAYINNVAIEESYRGNGLGRILMEALIADGLSKGILNYTLEVRVSNTPAIMLYESLGFECAGVRKRFYEQPVEDAYVYWLRK
ncbi:MAG: ribosomal protein S18-alanine N-acetyltransferase [Lachnospiraceae bacterium]|nr:ribosomal protein S18-alanine N-acetyltransferase [Lachnospiraceae bacterium]